MVCSHCPTPIQTPTPTKWVCNPIASVSLSMSVSGSMNTSTQFFIHHFLSGLCRAVLQRYNSHNKATNRNASVQQGIKNTTFVPLLQCIYPCDSSTLYFCECLDTKVFISIMCEGTLLAIANKWVQNPLLVRNVHQTM